MTHKHKGAHSTTDCDVHGPAFPTPKNPLPYRIGIDVGLNSVGLSAIEIAPRQSLENQEWFPLYAPPVRLLSVQSVIHDSGVDPNENKTGISRKATSGVARRSQRLRKQYRRRLKALDQTLGEHGYPIAHLDTSDPYYVWRVRAELLDHFIEDDQERRGKISLALRHIARHRGWRNPYLSAENLRNLAESPSDHYLELRRKIVLESDHTYQALMAKRKQISIDNAEPSQSASLFKEQVNQINIEISALEHRLLQDAGWRDEDQCDRNGQPKVDKETGEIQTKFVGPQSWRSQPYVSQIVNHLLFDSSNGAPQNISLRRNPEKSKIEPIDARLGKLGQEDNMAEILAIFAMQRVPESDFNPLLLGDRKCRVQRNGQSWTNTVGGVFSSVNPRDVGAAANLIAHDDLPGQRQFVRAPRASLAFQKYRIVASLQNLKVNNEHLTKAQLNTLLHGKDTEKNIHMNGLFELTRNEIDGITWEYLSTLLNIDRGQLRGMGRPLTYREYNSVTEHWETRELDESVSSQVPPTLTVESLFSNSNIPSIIRFWKRLSQEERSFDEGVAYKATISKERLIDSLENAGRSTPSSEAERQADAEIDALIATQLNEQELNDLENLGMKLPHGRAAYSINSLNKLTSTMIEHNVDLHAARGIAFFGWNPNIPEGTDPDNDSRRLANDKWSPQAAPLDEPTGSPSVDRTLKIVGRFLKACEREWGKPETVGIEVARDGFMSVSAARDIENENRRFYEDRKNAAQKLIDGENNRTGYTGRVEDISNADIRRIQAIQRQNGKCAYCAEPITLETSQMDHIVPRKGVGSTSTRVNLVATCQACNLEKGKTLFSIWAVPGRNNRGVSLTGVVKRINSEWQRDAGMNARQWKKYKSDVIGRLKATEEDDPIDNRSMESVAWMGRELRARLEGRYHYTIADFGENQDEELRQRVFVQQGIVTARARKIGHIENNLPWFGASEGKTRLDRRHHAVDASVIALMAPAVATVIYKAENLRKEQRDFMIPIELVKASIPDDYVLSPQTKHVSIGATEEIFETAINHNPRLTNIVGNTYWKRYRGERFEEREDGSLKLTDTNSKYQRWLDLMNTNHNEGGLVRLLIDGFQDGSIHVVRPVRRRLQNSKVHDDSVGKSKRKSLGDAWTLQELLRVGNYIWSGKTPIKVKSGEIYLALTEHEDYDSGEVRDVKDRPLSEGKWKGDTRVIPANSRRHIFVDGHELSATDKISVMIGGLNKDGSPIPVRGGYAAQGSAIHHARFYSWEDQRGKLQYGMLRVYAADLLKAYGKKQDLMTCELTDESYSWRYADQKMRAAQHEGILHYIGVMQQRDEIEVNRSKLIEQRDGISESAQVFYTSEVGHRTIEFTVAGFESPTRLKFTMSSLSPEGLISDFSGAAQEIKDKYSDAETMHRKLNDLVRKASKLYAFSDTDWISTREAILRPEAKERIENINKQVNGYWRPTVNVLFKLGFRLNIRDAFGNIRTNWSGSGHMPVSWSINYEGENAVEP
jgi:CRISPR-associated endonuclease Csn1